MTDDLVTEARQGGPCAALGDRCRAIEAASGCFCAAVADRIEALTAEVGEARKEHEGWQSAAVKLMEQVEALTAERDKAMAMQNVAYAAGYYQAECGLPEHESAMAALAELKALTAERERLALAICGGEDAPGYANAQTVETLEHVAKQNERSHGATINSLLAAEADNARLRDAIDYILDGMGIYEPDYIIDPDDDFLDAANSEWVRDTLERLASALTGKEPSHE